jgi:hypothetical protein
MLMPHDAALNQRAAFDHLIGLAATSYVTLPSRYAAWRSYCPPNTPLHQQHHQALAQHLRRHDLRGDRRRVGGPGRREPPRLSVC